KEQKNIIENTVAERTKELREKNEALEKAQIEISQGWLQAQREKARLAAIRVYNLKPENANNLVNLADIYRLEGNSREAEYFAKKAMEAEPENQNAKKILELLDEIE
ncbi:MAG TPA: hypothetical protein PL169_27880, partial [Leptospiraceae bacterium]|nr:hypothetical protein [Leptospiraceae bacterium]